jgi:hypothetical protein
MLTSFVHLDFLEIGDLDLCFLCGDLDLCFLGGDSSELCLFFLRGGDSFELSRLILRGGDSLELSRLTLRGGDSLELSRLILRGGDSLELFLCFLIFESFLRGGDWSDESFRTFLLFLSSFFDVFSAFHFPLSWYSCFIRTSGARSSITPTICGASSFVANNSLSSI